MLLQRAEDIQFLLEALIAALEAFLRLFQPPVDHFQVRHDELQVDNINIPQRIRAALDMGHIRIIKAADDMDDGIRIADVREEFIPQTLALARALDQPRDIDKFDDRRRKLLRLVLISQPLQPLIRHRDHPHIRVDGAKRIIIRRDPGIGDRIKQSRLPHIWQPDDT